VPEDIRRLRILNLEDNPLDTELVYATLAHGGIACNILRVQTREDFAAALERDDIDLILADYSLPSFDGLSALRVAQEIRPEVPFVLVSGALGEEMAIEALKSGATDYVLKQRLERLVPAVRRAVREAEERTERKRAEEALQYQLDLTRTITNNAADSLFLWDAEGRVTFMNPAAEQTFGWRQEELLGKVLHDSIHHHHPDGRPYSISECPLIRIFESGQTLREHEDLFFHKDGSPIDVALSHAPIFVDGKITGAALVVRDVTERKRAQEEIETRARQRAAVADLGRRALTAPDLLALMDQAVEVVANTLGVGYCEILELISEDDALLLRAGVGWKEELVGQATVSAGPESQAGYTLLSSDPVIVEDLREETRFSAPPLLHEHGVVSSMSVVIHGLDVPFGVLGAHTESRRAFTDDDTNFLQAVANVLATAVEREDAEKALRKVREAERQRMAHDLHDGALQDLTYALAEAQLVQTISEDPELSNRLERAVEALRRVGQELRGAVYDLSLGEEEEDRPLHELLESLVELNSRMAPDHEIRLEVEEGFTSDPLGEKGTQLLRILQEALTNTRRHSEARKVLVSLGGGGNEIWAEVLDDGRGFDLGTIPGMGLRSMYERARVLGGNLEIESEPEKGTKVRFRMALKRDIKELGSEEIRVLLVEDHSSFREAAASVFEREPGFEVVGQAGSLVEARQMLDGVDVAIIDLGLPDGYGGELIKELRGANPQAQALVLSASLERTQLARAVEFGAAGILHKSVTMEEVVEAVRRLRAAETLLPPEEVVELLRFAGSHREQEQEARQAIAQLTPREKEVLQALADGLDGKQIAEQLHISVQTERNHVTSILAKLGVHSRLQALVFALRYGIVQIGPQVDLGEG
jgi:PAS domain S-box-containing protein